MTARTSSASPGTTPRWASSGRWSIRCSRSATERTPRSTRAPRSAAPVSPLEDAEGGFEECYLLCGFWPARARTFESESMPSARLGKPLPSIHVPLRPPQPVRLRAEGDLAPLHGAVDEAREV